VKKRIKEFIQRIPIIKLLNLTTLIILIISLSITTLLVRQKQKITQRVEATPQKPRQQNGVKINKHVPGEIIIKFKKDFFPDEKFSKEYNIKFLNKILAKHKLKSGIQKQIEKVGLDRLYKAEVLDQELTNLLRALNQDENVEYAELNYIVTTLSVPNDPSFTNLWGLNNNGQNGGTTDADIDAPEAWSTIHDSNLVVGIIDTGIDYTHEDLKDNLWVNTAEQSGSAGVDDDNNGFIDDIYGYDFVNNDPDPFDDHGHGTHVAGTIGAVGNNGLGVVGVNWKAKIAAIKFLDANGSGTADNAVKAILYANQMGFKITSNSWGGGANSQALYEAITVANNAGNLFIAAAGNNSSDNDLLPMYPSSYDLPNIISVAATDYKDQLASFSNYGLTTVDLGAPGVNIYSTVPKGACKLCDPSGYRYLNGTSMATPHVSGTAVLLWSFSPQLSHSEIKNKIMNFSDTVIALQGKTVTNGRLNIYNFFDNDKVPPSAITDLAAVSIDFNYVKLTWTTVGDDGLVGQATRYDLRYSTVPIDENNFNSVSQAVNVPIPLASGQTQTFKLAGLFPNTTYYLAMKVLDNAGNASAISNVVVATTTNPIVIFSDNMENGINGWTVFKSPGEENVIWHQSLRKSVSPITSWYYGNEQTGNYDNGFGSAGTLVSPSINLTGIQNTHLVFRYSLSTEPDPYLWDIARVQIYYRGIVNLETLLYPMITNGVFKEETIDLSAYDGKDIKIEFDFNTVDKYNNNYEGWFIDNFQILGSTATPTPTPTSTPTPTPVPPTPTPTSTPDLTPPIVTITYPVNGGIVARNKTTTITATATDNIGVAKVAFYVNSTLKCSDTTTPFTCTWFVPAKKGANYTLSAKAYDLAGNLATYTVNVTAK